MGFVQRMVESFHWKFGQPIHGRPTIAPDDRANLRMRLIEEEYTELHQAVAEKDLIEIADALADLAYVVYGTAAEYGIDLDKVIEEVHRSNMLKLQPDGSVQYDQYGKVIKPDTWEPPRIELVLDTQRGERAPF